MTASWEQSVVSPVLVGRGEIVEALDAVLRHAGDGTGHTVLVAGEAGQGKSRLVAEVKTRAQQRNFLSLEGDCFEQDRALPFAPLLDLLRTLFAGRSAGEVSGLLGSTAPELVKLLPELARLLPDLAPAPTAEPEQEKRRLFQAFSEFFLRQATRQPLLIIVEDIHWSDAASLEYLRQLARRVTSQPRVLLLTYRSDEIHAGLSHFLAELDRQRLATQFELSPLTMAEVDLLVRAIFRLGRPVRPEFLEVIYPLTEGNPFFIEEVLKSLLAAGEISSGEAGWDRKPIADLHIPHSVQDAVQRRVEHLSEPARRSLTLAAVAGRRFDLRLLQEILAVDDDQLLQAMKELIAAQLVAEESSEQFAFRHALTREAVYAILLRLERKRHHFLIAETLERASPEALGARVADLAYHFYEAEEWAKATEYSRRAGDRAQTVYAPREAVEHFTRALEASRRLFIAPAQSLLRARGQAFEMLGDFERALADYQMALETAQSSRQATGEWQALMDLGFIWASRKYDAMGDYFLRALALAREMGDPATLAHTLNRLGNWHLNLDRPLEALAHHQEALGIFQRANDDRGLAETLDLLGMASYVSGDLFQGTANFERAVALFRGLDARAGLASSLATMILRGATYQSETLVAPATLAEAAMEGQAALKVAREIAWRPGEAYALWVLSICMGAQAEYGRALELATTSAQVAEEIERRQWMCAAYCALGALHTDMFALPLARQYLEKAHALANEVGSLHWIRCAAGYLASACLLQKETGRADAVLQAALRSDSPTQTMGQRLAWRAQARLAFAQNRPDLALEIVDRLIATAANVTHGRVIPSLWHLRGQALCDLQQGAEAEATWQAALAAARVQGARPLVWRIQAALGHMYWSQVRRTEAEETFSAARALIDEIAASLIEGALRDDFLHGALALMPAVRSRSGRHVTEQDLAGLTTREREVAGLIATGMSNGEIARALVVGKRTIETHVGNIMSKLGVDTRARIIAWAIEKRLAPRR